MILPIFNIIWVLHLFCVSIGSTHPPNILQAASTTPLTYDACEKLITDMPNGGAGIINDGNICIGSTSLEGSCHVSCGE